MSWNPHIFEWFSWRNPDLWWYGHLMKSILTCYWSPAPQMSRSVIFMPGIALFHRNPLYLNPWLWSIYITCRVCLYLLLLYFCCFFLLFLHYTCMSMFNICIYIPKFNYNLTVNVVVNFFLYIINSLPVFKVVESILKCPINIISLQWRKQTNEKLWQNTLIKWDEFNHKLLVLVLFCLPIKWNVYTACKDQMN